MQIKKRQQRAAMILDSLKVNYETIDITEPGHDEDKELIRERCKKREGQTIPMTPQFFNEDDYCGVYSATLNISIMSSNLHAFNLF